MVVVVVVEVEYFILVLECGGCKKETGRRAEFIGREVGASHQPAIFRRSSVTVLGKARPGNDKNPNIT